jgi:hypothetical protein
VRSNSIDFAFLVDTPGGQVEEDTWTIRSDTPANDAAAGNGDQDLPPLLMQTVSADIPSAV